MTVNSFNKRVRFWTKWPQVVKTIVILTSGRQNDGNFDMRYFLSIWGPRVSRKNDPKSQNDGEFFQQKGPFLTKWPQVVKTIVILTSGLQNDSNFDIRCFLSIRGPRLSRKNDPKYKNDGEFSHDPPPPKVHHKKLSRTKMLSLRKKMSDL